MTKRCSWVKMTNPLYIAYHDEEWGQPLHDDQALFELLCRKPIRQACLGKRYSTNAKLSEKPFIAIKFTQSQR
ncbi:DNA-3-methyladenine glycosylase I [Streptococcus pneumoniae]|nr:DNA-3-methyladenine glycosylase I [Streptococcus pneumoniae]CJB02764.1 DNA-3-methyladenine glycosylase I [Streptococcus pneumoniae]CJB05174.1 DNA-3-methyladenine glycosylase I [Streptococcus pneumoniae]COE78319.1 DNA-3-methyladenine glycosylase I [Streptococcus pneumoniae]COH62692.1 DNA-3-methyladenine glycosylase I [Streptococcus pneumoniae]